MNIRVFSPRAFQKYLQQNTISYGYCHTSIGTLTVFTTEDGIYKTSFDTTEEDLKNYSFSPHIALNKFLLIGTPFQCKVWQATLAIPIGNIMSYQELAALIGHPQSSRAVANALADNKIPYLIPCHRIIRKDGSLGGYSAGGIEKKEALLAAEGVSCNCDHAH
jgi:O-6-methylguanine DNA methyltransferase